MLENICIRILILDISEKKSNHELYGFTVHEEYNFYIKHFWKNESYKCDLAIRYAEGSRLQKLKEKYFVTGMDPAAMKKAAAMLKARCGTKPTLLATHDKEAIRELGWKVIELG